MKKVAIVLSGAGALDGTEIQEAVIAMLALERAGAAYECLSIDEECHVVNHITGEAIEEKRNVLVESARIARGEIRDIAHVRADDYAAVIIPGGFGVASNLSSYAAVGVRMAVHPEVHRFLCDARAAGLPLGGICTAPVLLAKLFRDQARVTIGNDPETAKNIRVMGATHVDCAADEAFNDPVNKIVTVPGYMLAQNMAQLADGIDKLVAEVLNLASHSMLRIALVTPWMPSCHPPRRASRATPASSPRRACRWPPPGSACAFYWCPYSGCAIGRGNPCTGPSRSMRG